jgi:cation transport ATPase
MKVLKASETLSSKITGVKDDLRKLEREVRNISDRVSSMMDSMEEIQSELSLQNKLEVGEGVETKTKEQEEKQTAAVPRFHPMLTRGIVFLLFNLLASTALIWIVVYWQKTYSAISAFVYLIVLFKITQDIMYSIYDAKPVTPLGIRGIIAIGIFIPIMAILLMLFILGETYLALGKLCIYIFLTVILVRTFKRVWKNMKD